ncbi:MAG: DUF4167 domain-containing protein [Rhizobiaceae bacterium]|nr:DUF4167 domain-containing protein [Rhizobiaceae bacterium]
MRQNNNNNNNNNNRNRLRGRGRKSSNPMNRNFESNGPDVKIRGNASLIAEKYTNLARDALTSGDPVMAENYFQHAEHYNRIVALAQQNSAPQQQAKPNEENRGNNGSGPQPEIEGVPAEVALTENDNEDSARGEGEQPSENKPRARRNNRSRPKRSTGDENTGDVVEAEPAVVEAEPVKAEVAAAPEAEAEVADVKPRSRTRRPRVKKDANISDDAAKLPGNLTAAPVAADEDAPTPVAAED